MTYLPQPTSQIDGSAYQMSNCVLAASTSLTDRSTVGTDRPLPAVLRILTGDTSGGVTYLQAQNAVDKATKGRVKLAAIYGIDRDKTRDLSAAGHGFGISIDCSVTRYTARRTGTYTGGHTVYVQAYQWRAGGSVCSCERLSTLAHGEFLIDDPGTTAAGFLWWSANLVYRAAESRGGGLINVLVGPDTEGISRKGIMAARIRAKPSTTAADKGPVVLGKVYPVGETVNGGAWTRADGTSANGWNHVTNGYIKGEALR